MSTDNKYDLEIRKLKNGEIIFLPDDEMDNLFIMLSDWLNYEEGFRVINDEGEIHGIFNWYYSTENIKKFSKTYPEILFILQEYCHDDFKWVTYYIIDGKIQTENAKFDSFNAKKLV